MAEHRAVGKLRCRVGVFLRGFQLHPLCKSDRGLNRVHTGLPTPSEPHDWRGRGATSLVSGLATVLLVLTAPFMCVKCEVLCISSSGPKQIPFLLQVHPNSNCV